MNVEWPPTAGGAAFPAGWFFVWVCVITPTFVRRAADRYAAALIESDRSDDDVAPDARA